MPKFCISLCKSQANSTELVAKPVTVITNRVRYDHHSAAEYKILIIRNFKPMIVGFHLQQTTFRAKLSYEP